MLVQAQLVFAALDLGCHCEVDSLLQGRQTHVRAGLEGVARVLSNNTDPVRRSLSQGSAIMIRIPADCTDDVLEICLIEIGWPQVLHHIVKDEKGKFLAFLLETSEAVWNDLIAKSLHQTTDTLLVRLEQLAH